MDLIDGLSDVAALLLGQWRDRLTRSEVAFLEVHRDRGDWLHKDIQTVHEMLPHFARSLLDPTTASGASE